MAEQIRVGQIHGNYTVVHVSPINATLIHNETQAMHIIPLKRVVSWTHKRVIPNTR